MNKFGLACEGITDQITLENILCGYFENPDLDGEIIELQPHLDETDQKQKNFGGWEKLLDYLDSSRFREDIINVEYVIIQLDSDIADHPNLGISYHDDNGLELIPEQLIKKIIAKLVSEINSDDGQFFQQYKEKIIFSISVHSLECWLYAYHNTKYLSKPKITGCGKALNYLLNTKGFQGKKSTQLYREYSTFFLKRENIAIVAEKDPSFKYFIQLLDKAN